jgi:hypothetical protein
MLWRLLSRSTFNAWCRQAAYEAPLADADPPLDLVCRTSTSGTSVAVRCWLLGAHCCPGCERRTPGLIVSRSWMKPAATSSAL